MAIRLSGIVMESIVDGPGIRRAVFAQGCDHRCPGCHNKQTWDKSGGFSMEPGEIVEKMRQNPLLRGITLTGGEPFLQPEGMAELAQIARDNGYDVVAYTGYKFEDLIQKGGGQSQIRSMLKLVDLLIDGLYEQADRRLELPFRGSLNQRLVLARQSLNEGKLVTLDESRLYEPFPSIHIMME